MKDTQKTIFELASDPCIDIFNPEFHPSEIDSVIFSSCAADQYGSAILAETLGISPRICQRVDSLCNSGTNSIVTGYSLIASGLVDSVLIAGAEKRDSPGNHLLWDASRGAFSLPIHWAALFAKAHMRMFGTTELQLAEVAAKNRSAAVSNENALFHQTVTVEEVMQSKKLVDPLKLLDCSAPCCGAAAVLLVSEEKAKSIENPVWIRGIGQQTNSASFANSTSDLLTIESAASAAKRAFEMSNMRADDIDIAEVHDAFSILEILAIEDLGFVQKGEGGKQTGKTQQVINPRGGLLGTGHPVGATGVAQVCEIVKQLQGGLDRGQVDDCKTGLVHNLAAAGSSATVLILGVDK